MTPTKTQWPKTHYVYVEKVGPFMETAQKAWQELHAQAGNVPNVTGGMALYKMKPDMIYRAGWIVSEKPQTLPPGLAYECFDGGSYAKFTYQGSYSNLPKVSGDVWESVHTQNLALRDGWAIEHYANDPTTTPEDRLVTEILVPTQS